MSTATRVDLGRVEVVTMRELTLHTAKVIDRVRELMKVRVITRHGRLAGFIEPLMTEAPGHLLAYAINKGLLAMPADDALAVTSDEMRASIEDSPSDSQDVPRHQIGVATSQDLNQHTKDIMDRVGNGEHLIVTRHGRPLVMLHPFADGTIAHLLSQVPEFVGTPETGMHDGVGYGLPTSVMEAMTD